VPPAPLAIPQAVNVTICPNEEGLGLDVSVIVQMVSVTAVEVLELSFASPL